MGRELKQVPLDFKWPIDKVWGGFVNPYSSQSINCPQCDGGGQSPTAKRLSDQWYGNAPFRPEDRGSVPLKPTDPPVWDFAERNVKNAPEFYGRGKSAITIEATRLTCLWNAAWSHHLNQDDVDVLWDGGRLSDFKTKPTAKQVNEWSLVSFGHDSINQWKVVSAECKRLGIVDECGGCGGKGTLWPSTEIEKRSDEWEPEQPPTGEGYQIWETVSEGSPISPVFATPDELAEWMSLHNRGVDVGTSREQWLKFITGPGWAPSFLMGDGKFQTGVQAA